MYGSHIGFLNADSTDHMISTTGVIQLVMQLAQEIISTFFWLRFTPCTTVEISSSMEGAYILSTFANFYELL